MDETVRQLYMLPMTVGHYCPHKDAEYYTTSAVCEGWRAEQRSLRGYMPAKGSSTGALSAGTG